MQKAERCMPPAQRESMNTCASMSEDANWMQGAQAWTRMQVPMQAWTQTPALRRRSLRQLALH